LNKPPLPLYFNLSHSGNFAALAICTRGEIGVDIETARKRSYLQIVERFFHADEIKQLHLCDKEQQEKLFYCLWTLKEAFFKAIGTGISAGLDKAYFDLRDNIVDANFAGSLNVQKNAWQFHQEFITPTTVVAIALNSGEPIKTQWIDGNSLLAIE
jgi:4'-phosphopantetheinyl transferase